MKKHTFKFVVSKAKALVKKTDILGTTAGAALGHQLSKPKKQSNTATQKAWEAGRLAGWNEGKKSKNMSLEDIYKGKKRKY